MLVLSSSIGTVVSPASAPGCPRARPRASRRHSALKGGDADGASTRIARIDRRRRAARRGRAARHGCRPSRGLPLFGYAAIAALLFGAVLLVPMLTVKMLRLAPRLSRVVPDTALAQLEGNIGCRR